MAFKILSIDGGGLRGVVPVMILKELEKRTGKKIFELVDLFAGTSAGAFITCGLTASDDGKTTRSSLDQIEKIYTERGSEIFPSQNWLSNVSCMFAPKYKNNGIKNILQEMAGELTLKNCLKPILVPTYDLNSSEPLFFKTRQAHISSFCDARLMDICCASSAAPTIFAPYEFIFQGKKRLCVDGGIFMNNPALGAITEVSRHRDYYGINDLSEISVLSLGTGSFTDDISNQKMKGWGILSWITPIHEVMMQGVAKTTTYKCEEFLPDGNFIRATINIDVKKYSDMTDCSKNTLDYIMGKVTKEILKNERLMDNMAALLCEDTPFFKEQQFGCQTLI